jgi:hypothetical protein
MALYYREIFKRDGWVAPYVNHSRANRIQYPEQYSKEGLQKTSRRFWSSQELRRLQREQWEILADDEEYSFNEGNSNDADNEEDDYY